MSKKFNYAEILKPYRLYMSST